MFCFVVSTRFQNKVMNFKQNVGDQIRWKFRGVLFGCHVLLLGCLTDFFYCEPLLTVSIINFVKKFTFISVGLWSRFYIIHTKIHYHCWNLAQWILEFLLLIDPNIVWYWWTPYLRIRKALPFLGTLLKTNDNHADYDTHSISLSDIQPYDDV